MEISTTYRNVAIAGVLLLLLGYGTGRYLQPANVVIKKEEVIKEVETTHKDVVTHEHTVKNKDGSEVTDRTTEDKSTEVSNKQITEKESTTITNKKPDWFITAGAEANSISNIANPTYQLGVNRRILGPIFLGGNAALGGGEHRVGIQIGIEF